jgi:hypothetical protein
MILPSRPFGVIASSRPRVVVAVSDVTPNAVNWASASGSGAAQTNEQTITGINTAINLVITWSGNDVGFFDININGTPYDLEVYGSPATFSILNNSIISFAAGSATGKVIYITVTNASDGNAVLDTVTLAISGEGECFLTTAVVTHMGGLDNGPELTAMRMLRDHYRSIQSYALEIQDYYTYSPLIVNSINNSIDKDAIYLEIYATVKACESFVTNSQWEQAWDQYMTMYLNLKGRFI